MDWKELIGKRIFLKSNSGVYSGKVVDVDSTFITLIDKFDARVSIAISEIVKVVENEV